MRCRICNADHAEYDPVDNNWYCSDCLDVIQDTLSEYPEIEELDEYVPED
jgi:hypothetical protein